MRLILLIVVALMAADSETGFFQKCIQGPAEPYAFYYCTYFDIDGDDDVDLRDWADWIIDHPDGV